MPITLWQQLVVSACSLIGLYTCYAFYAESIGDPRFCVNGACSLLSRTRYYRLFYFPNWYYGTVLYLALMLAMALNLPAFNLLVGLGAIAAFLTSMVLIWALTTQLHTTCRNCYIAHACNMAILLSLGLAYFTR